jgi:cell division protein FtsW (lipid II flippase)
VSPSGRVGPGRMRGERYGLWLLLVSAVVGLVVALILALAPNAILTEPGFSAGKAPLAIRVWGVTWVGFSIFAPVLGLLPYRRGERRAWWTLWLLPLLWLIHFLLVPSAV